MSITHSTIVVVPDDGTSPVGTDEWNAAHTITDITATSLTSTSSVVAESFFLVNTNTAAAAALFLGSDFKVTLFREADYILALARDANATAFRVYNTRTDASNYERGVFSWTDTANVLMIGTQAAGSGIARNVGIATAGGTVEINNGTPGTLRDLTLGHLIVPTNTSTSDFSIRGAFATTGINVNASGNINIGGDGAGLTATFHDGLTLPRTTAYIEFGNLQSKLHQAGTSNVSGILEQRFTTLPQSFRVYNTYTDASNYERGIFSWTDVGNTLTIGTQAAGTGTARNVNIAAAGGTVEINNGTAGTYRDLITRSITRSGRVLDTVVTLTDGATVALDAAGGNVFKLLAAGNRTISVPTNKPAAGQYQKIVIMHEASGADRTLALTTGSAGAFRFGTDITALTATTSGLTDYIGCIYNSVDDRWDVVSVSKGF